MSRRGILGGVGALAAAALTGCSVLRKDRAELITEAVLEIPGVTGASLRTGTNNRFLQYVAGDVEIDADSRSAGLATYDEAIRAAVTILHDREEDTTVIGGITGRMADGIELTPLELDPDFPSDSQRLDGITARILYSRYGLE